MPSPLKRMFPKKDNSPNDITVGEMTTFWRMKIHNKQKMAQNKPKIKPKISQNAPNVLNLDFVIRQKLPIFPTVCIVVEKWKIATLFSRPLSWVWPFVAPPWNGSTPYQSRCQLSRRCQQSLQQPTTIYFCSSTTMWGRIQPMLQWWPLQRASK